jgi:magnesium-transporting ATPase (P-type)
VVRAILWGRNIYQNVKRFVQFQVTANFACLAIVFFSCAIYGKSPLNFVMLLWINMIMDTFGAIALATERPQTKIIIDQRPMKRDENVITKEIWRQIIGVSIWMFLVLAMMLMAGRSIWSI